MKRLKLPRQRHQYMENYKNGEEPVAKRTRRQSTAGSPTESIISEEKVFEKKDVEVAQVKHREGYRHQQMNDDAEEQKMATKWQASEEKENGMKLNNERDLDDCFMQVKYKRKRGNMSSSKKMKVSFFVDANIFQTVFDSS